MACNTIEFTRLLFVETLFDGTETHVGIFISFIQTIDYWLMFLITHVALWVQHILQQNLKWTFVPFTSDALLILFLMAADFIYL